MIHYLGVSLHRRSQRHSATAAVAYRVGLDLHDVHTGELHAYGHRDDEVLKHGIEGGAFKEPQAWADAIERAETRKNSQFFRDFQCAIPHELARGDQIELAQRFAGQLAAKYDTSVMWAVHKAADHEDADSRNVHAHIVLPTRALASEDSFTKGAKIRHLGRADYAGWHDDWQEAQMDAFEVAGVTPEERPDTPQPRVHLGPTATALERKRARALDRDSARKEGKPYVPVRRSVQELLAYTKGASRRGRLWLRDLRDLLSLQTLQQIAEEAKSAVRNTIEELRTLTGRQRRNRAGPPSIQPAYATAGAPRAPPLDQGEGHDPTTDETADDSGGLEELARRVSAEADELEQGARELEALARRDEADADAAEIDAAGGASGANQGARRDSAPTPTEEAGPLPEV